MSVTAEHLEYLRTTLDRLVRIDSTNPKLGGPGEREMEVALAEELRAAGISTVSQHVCEGRSNVVGRVNAGEGAPTVVLDAHLDTVGHADGQFAHWEDDTLYGRGACDTKGSLVAMLCAVRRFAQRPTRDLNVILLGTVDEEVSVAGAAQAVDLVGDADLILVGEPTGLNIGISHKGTTRFHIETAGTPGHSSMADLSANAIYRMAPVLQVIQEDIVPALADMRDDRGEGCRASVGWIAGGGALNQVPHSCQIGIDVRRVVGVETSAVIALFRSIFTQRLPDAQIRIGDPFVSSASFKSSATKVVRDRLSALSSQCGCAGEQISLPFGTNANRLDRKGAPVIITGPGDITYAHADDEQITLGEVAAASEFYFRVLTDPDLRGMLGSQARVA